MSRIALQELSKQLNRLFFQPFVSGETTELRAEAIQAYLKASGWDWDSYLDASWMEDKN